MRSALLLVPFAADVVLKVLSRITPDALGRFSFSTPAGTIGLAPSVNSVLAFSLPVPNAVIWPVGWLIVAALLWELRRIFPPKADLTPEAHPSFGVTSRAENFRFQIPDRRVTAIGIVVLGAISNLFDRTFLGGVTDYLSLTNLFPAFNVADLLIIGGIVAWMRGTRRA